MNDLAQIVGAVLLAAAGGEAFLKSILGAAIHLRVPKMVVATTLAAFATSSPELTVSSVAALALALSEEAALVEPQGSEPPVAPLSSPGQVSPALPLRLALPGLEALVSAPEAP